VGGKWSAGVIGRLAHGPARFGPLRHAAQGAHAKPPTAKVLADELRRLEAAHVVVRTQANGQAPRYRLTDKGRALVPLLDGLAQWAVPSEEAGAPRGGLEDGTSGT
ncbi:MAG: helix-turn-helix domain-containing protein, partial [Bacteroidota bacterium]